MGDGQGETPLQRGFCFWFLQRHKASTAAYEDSIKPIGSFNTVEGFWQLYDHLLRPDELQHSTELHLFAEGVKPTWEDPVNAEGGKWRVRLRKGLGSRYWEELVLAIIGEQFDVGDEICGAVISVRAAEDILSVWTKTADDLQATTRIRDQLRRILHLPNNIPMDYKKHHDSNTTTATSTKTAPTAAPAVTSRQHSIPPRREWGQSVAADLTAGSEAAPNQQWDRRSHRSGPPARDGDSSEWGKPRSMTRDTSDERRGFKKSEGERGWERSRRYQHGGATQSTETNRWSRGMSVPETAPATAADAAQAGDVHKDDSEP